MARGLDLIQRRCYIEDDLLGLDTVGSIRDPFERAKRVEKHTEGSFACSCDRFPDPSNYLREGPVSFLLPAASQRPADQAESR